ncbi:MAG: efflux RND transporter periplasmic adaptor subunit, partial [Oceanidesulfovibrio sp.]
ISALIEKVHAREGTAVSRGDVLYTLDADTIESELNAARAALQSAKAELKDASATHDRFRMLYERQTISREEYEERFTAFKTAEAEVERLEARVQLMRERLEDSTIRSPMDGVIAEHQMDPGAYVEAGDTLVTIYKMDPLEISFRIPEGYMDRVEPGQTVFVELTTGDIARHEGEVSFVSPSIDQATRKFLVKALVDNSDGTLKPGAFASAQVVLDVREDKPAVPEHALVSRRRGYALFVVEDDHAVRRQVRIGLRRPGVVEIVSGVEVGETVVTAGQTRLEDGVEVHLEKDRQANATANGGAAMNATETNTADQDGSP